MKNNSLSTQKALLSVQIFKFALEIFTNTFLTSYIVSLSSESIFKNGLLNIGLLFVSQFLVYIIVYYFLSYFVKKSKGINFLRIGVLINACLIMVFVFFGKQLSSWVILAGMLCGCADAFYYSSYLVLKNQLNSRANMNNYNIFSTIFGNLVKVIVPIVLGYLIDLTSYVYIAIYIVILVFVQFGLTFFINTKEHLFSEDHFDLRSYYKFLKENKKERKEIRYTYINALLAGGKSTYKIIVVVLTIMMFKTNFSLGIFTSIFSLLAILFLLLFKKLDKKIKIKMSWVYFFLGVMPFITCITLICFFNKTTLIIYNFFLTLTISMSEYLGSLERDAIIKNINKREFITEHQFTVEAFQNVGRIVSYCLFIVFSLFGSLLAFQILFCFLLMLNPVKFVVMYKQRKIRLEYQKSYGVESESQLKKIE